MMRETRHDDRKKSFGSGVNQNIFSPSRRGQQDPTRIQSHRRQHANHQAMPALPPAAHHQPGARPAPSLNQFPCAARSPEAAAEGPHRQRRREVRPTPRPPKRETQGQNRCLRPPQRGDHATTPSTFNSGVCKAIAEMYGRSTSGSNSACVMLCGVFAPESISGLVSALSRGVDIDPACQRNPARLSAEAKHGTVFRSRPDDKLPPTFTNQGRVESGCQN